MDGIDGVLQRIADGAIEAGDASPAPRSWDVSLWPVRASAMTLSESRYRAGMVDKSRTPN